MMISGGRKKNMLRLFNKIVDHRKIDINGEVVVDDIQNFDDKNDTK